MKVATFVNSRQLCCTVLRLDYDMVRHLPSIGASKPLAKIYSGGWNMWSDGRCLLSDGQARLPPTIVGRMLGLTRSYTSVHVLYYYVFLTLKYKIWDLPEGMKKMPKGCINPGGILDRSC